MESSIALMQMSRTALAVNELKKKNVPFIVVLTDPTTGGVTASWAMLGDFLIAEPKATIGFAGKRVISDTIRETLPPDFQTAEFVEKHGLNVTLLADPEKNVVKRFSGTNLLGWANGKSFLIDPFGKLRKIYDTVDTKTHAQEVLRD